MECRSRRSPEGNAGAAFRQSAPCVLLEIPHSVPCEHLWDSSANDGGALNMASPVNESAAVQVCTLGRNFLSSLDTGRHATGQPLPASAPSENQMISLIYRRIVIPQIDGFHLYLLYHLCFGARPTKSWEVRGQGEGRHKKATQRRSPLRGEEGIFHRPLQWDIRTYFIERSRKTVGLGAVA